MKSIEVACLRPGVFKLPLYYLIEYYELEYFLPGMFIKENRNFYIYLKVFLIEML